MYKVRYDAYSKSSDGSIGNIVQYRDTYFTEHKIEDIPKELQKVLDIIREDKKYKVVPFITEIEYIEGHGER
jgi:NRPS condensation-like uncharacterized protein